MISAFLCAGVAESPEPGPYFFMSDAAGSERQYPWGRTGSYGGVAIVENFNLLAHVLGDVPRAPAGAKLIPPEPFRAAAVILELQPFAVTRGEDLRKRGLDIAAAAPKLAAFLADPLGGAAFDLTLPFVDSRVALSDSSALLRPSKTEDCWHTAMDLDVSGASTAPFDVVAPADGIVEGNTGSVTLAIKHTASNGREFLTIYSHIVPESKSHLTKGTLVQRGERLGRIDERGKYAHLHFSVAVRGPAGRAGETPVPAMWYVIDPLGVYDYRRNRRDAANYNYLRDNDLTSPVRGIQMVYVFRTNPLIGSLPVPAALQGTKRQTETTK